MARVEAGMGRDGDAHVRHPDPAGLVAVRVDGGDRRRVRIAREPGGEGGNALVGPRPEVHRRERREPVRAGQREPGDRPERAQHLLAGRDGRIAPAREHARRRLGPVRDPGPQVLEGGAKEGAVVDRVEPVRPAAPEHAPVRERQDPGAVLGSGEEVAPDRGGGLQVRRRVRGAVRPGFEVAVGEPRVPAPVLRRGVGVDDLRRAARRPRPVEQPFAPSGAGVGPGLVGEREAVPEARGRLHRGLSVAVVELAAPPARDVDVHPVEHALPRLVPVEAGVEEGPQEPAALRDPFRDHVVDPAGGGRVGAPPRPRREVAHREEPRPDHRALGRGVEEVVDPARLEAAGERDAARAGRRRIPLRLLPRPGERPAVPRDAYRGGEQGLAHPQLGRRVLGVERRDRRVVADRADVVVGEGERVGRPVGLDAELHPSVRLPFPGRHGGGAQPEAHRGVRNVPLPSAPRDAPSPLEQEAVPRGDLVGRHEVERRHVERAHREPVAPVRRLEEQRAVGAPGVHRHEEGRVAVEAHPAVVVPFGPVEVDDGRVGGVAGVHRVVRDGVDPLVGAPVAEGPAAGERPAPHDLESNQGHLPPPPSLAVARVPVVRADRSGRFDPAGSNLAIW